MKRMIRQLPVIFMVLFCTLTVSCEKPEGELVPQDYHNWEKTTETQLTYPIPGHENHYRVPYINQTGEAPDIALRDGVRSLLFKPGTIIVKEVYETLSPSTDAKPTSLTVMIKSPDDPRARGGWLWIVKNPATNRETVMRNQFCITCHANANESHPYGDKNPNREFRDYVFFVYEETPGDAR